MSWVMLFSFRLAAIQKSRANRSRDRVRDRGKHPPLYPHLVVWRRRAAADRKSINLGAISARWANAELG